MNANNTLRILATSKLKKPTADKLKQIKQRERLRRIGLALLKKQFMDRTT